MSQLSRAVETRGGTKKPMLSDLRESGAIEQDADIVMFIYRPEYYGIVDDEKGATAGMADIILAKHRSGGTGEVRLRFVGKYARFENADIRGSAELASAANAQLPQNTGFDQAGSVQPNAMIVDSRMNIKDDNNPMPPMDPNEEPPY